MYLTVKGEIWNPVKLCKLTDVISEHIDWFISPAKYLMFRFRVTIISNSSLIRHKLPIRL